MTAEFERMGFVYLSTYDKPGRGRDNDDHSRDYKILRGAIKSGEVEGIQLGSKRWMVRKKSADEFLKRQVMATLAKQAPQKREPALADNRMEAAVVAVCEINNGISLIAGLLERLTAAVESIATTTKAEPVGSWRDMNGESL